MPVIPVVREELAVEMTEASGDKGIDMAEASAEQGINMIEASGQQGLDMREASSGAGIDMREASSGREAEPLVITNTAAISATAAVAIPVRVAAVEIATVKEIQPQRFLESSEAEITEGFVIQFTSVSQLSYLARSAQLLKAVEPLYVGDKDVKGKKYYCLISQIYSDIKTAQQALSASGLSGWVLKNNVYNNMRIFEP